LHELNKHYIAKPDKLNMQRIKKNHCRAFAKSAFRKVKKDGTISMPKVVLVRQ